MQTDKITLEARRAEVARMAVQRMSTRDMASLLGVSQSTVAKDIKALRAEWRKDRGGFDEQLDDQAHDLAVLQREAFELLDQATGSDKLFAIDRALKVTAERSKLLGLYPKPANTDGTEIPTGPITLQLEIIEAGNKKLIHATEDELEAEARQLEAWAPGGTNNGE